MISNFTLVSTVFNEGERLDSSLEDIENQSVLPEEIIITDGGSTDGTLEKLQQWKITSGLNIKILVKQGCNVASGRNLAIKTAGNELIVSTDFGCRFHRDWLQSLIEKFDNPEVEIVGGAFTVNSELINSLAAKANFLLTNGYHVKLDEQFIPSSRSIAYYRLVWEKVDGYPEWLSLAADDLVFGLKLKSKKFMIKLVDKPYVFWDRHNKLSGYLKESYRYGLGDGEARVNRRNMISNLAEFLLRWGLYIYIALMTLFLSPGGNFNIFIFFPLILLVPASRSYAYAFRNWLLLKSHAYHLGVFLYSLILIELSRWKYIKGYINGYFFSSGLIRESAKALHRKYL